jgi:ribosomal protein S12 methylthiotransferase
VSASKLRSRVGATMQVLVDSAPGNGSRKAAWVAAYADAPEIDGTVQAAATEKISKTLKVGEFTRARIVGTQGHDLVASRFDQRTGRVQTRAAADFVCATECQYS